MKTSAPARPNVRRLHPLDQFEAAMVDVPMLKEPEPRRIDWVRVIVWLAVAIVGGLFWAVVLVWLVRRLSQAIW